tara:strand:- start:391 stop:921 length:531 start_codon:yes stop_codon:yes gene_type:complete
MNSAKKILVITASNGKNLELGERFLDLGREMGQEMNLLDLTKWDLPLYNPRTHKEKGIPDISKELNTQLKSSSHWIICAPEYNGSIPPLLTNAIAWLSVQEDDFRELFNGRPIAMGTFSGGGGMELLLSLRIQLTHLGAQVLGRQLLSNYNKPPKDESIKSLLIQLSQMQKLKTSE